MSEHCRYCGGGAVDLAAHEENCVQRPPWDEPRFKAWWYAYCESLGLATSDGIARIAYDAYKAGYDMRAGEEKKT